MADLHRVNWRAVLALFLVFCNVPAWAVDCGKEWRMANNTYTRDINAAAATFVGATVKLQICGDGSGSPFSIYPKAVIATDPVADNFTFTNSYCNDSHIFPGPFGPQGLDSRAANCEVLCEPPKQIIDGVCKDKCAEQAGKQFGMPGCNSIACRLEVPAATTDVTGMCNTRGMGDGSPAAQQYCAISVNKQMGACDGGKCYAWVTDLKFTGGSCVAGLGFDVPTSSVPGGSTGTTPGSTGTVTSPITPNAGTPGKCTSEFNGVSLELPCSTTNAPPTTGTTSTTTVNPDGSSTTVTTTGTTTTTCTGNVCTTSTTGTTSTTSTPTSGSPTTTVTGTTVAGTSTLAAFCKGNSESALCGKPGGTGTGDGEGEGGSFGGDCVSEVFVCEGDAAMCATAKATNLLNCSVHTSKTANEVLAYNASVAAGTATGLQSSTVNISSASFDQSNALGTGASCIADKTIVVSGKSVTIPFSMVCPYMVLIGNLMLALSFLSAIMIIGKGNN